MKDEGSRQLGADWRAAAGGVSRGRGLRKLDLGRKLNVACGFVWGKIAKRGAFGIGKGRIGRYISRRLARRGRPRADVAIGPVRRLSSVRSFLFVFRRRGLSSSRIPRPNCAREGWQRSAPPQEASAAVLRPPRAAASGGRRIPVDPRPFRTILVCRGRIGLRRAAESSHDESAQGWAEGGFRILFSAIGASSTTCGKASAQKLSPRSPRSISLEDLADLRVPARKGLFGDYG
jgi:hypothetical protein